MVKTNTITRIHDKRFIWMRFPLGFPKSDASDFAMSCGCIPLKSVYDILFPILASDDDALISQSVKYNMQNSLSAQTVLGRC